MPVKARDVEARAANKEEVLAVGVRRRSDIARAERPPVRYRSLHVSPTEC